MFKASLLIFCMSVAFYAGKQFGDYQQEQAFFYEVAQELRGQS
jgi:hypothetical protein